MTAVESPAGRLDGEALSLKELLALPVFAGCPEEQLRKNLSGVVRRQFAPGEVICREGAFGSTAFLILDGVADVRIETPVGHLEGKPRVRGLLGGAMAFDQTLVRREASDRRGTIPIDAPVDLPLDGPEAAVGAGDLVGELTCMALYPRSATVRARSAVTALEMLRGVLDLLKRGSPSFQADLGRAYRERALPAHLRAIPLLGALTDELVAGLAACAKFVAYDPGQEIFRQGDAADRVFVIRTGFVRVAQERRGGDVVLGYLGRGGFFGETGLFAGSRRTATCTAFDRVEVAEISREEFDGVVEDFPAVRQAMEESARALEPEVARRLEELAAVARDDLLERGVLEAPRLLLIDLDRCTRCDDCVRGCAASHGGVTRLVRDGLRFDDYLVPTSCRACHDPLCMVGCPVGSMRRLSTLEIAIEDWCIGCGLCARGCPYGNLNLDEAGEGARKAVTCDLCAGLDETPCAYACPHEALLRVETREFFTRRG